MNEALAPWLDRALSRGLAMPAHALLVHAGGTLGPFDLALALARAWLCESPQATRRACGHCAACRLMDSHSHPDFQILLPDTVRLQMAWGGTAEVAEEGDAKTKAKPSREIRIYALRAAVEAMQKTAARGQAKVMLIHPAEAMNGVTANALLKTLEEPPGSLRLVLTATDPEALLPTVRSRCQRLAVEQPAVDEAQAWLAVQAAPEAAALLAAAGGQPQAALDLVADGLDAAAWSAVPAAVRRGQATALSTWPVARVVDALHKLCHDLMCIAVGAAPSFFDAASLAPLLRPPAPPLAALGAWQRELLRAARHDEHPWHAALRIEALVAQAAALWHTPRASPSGRGRALATLPRR